MKLRIEGVTQEVKTAESGPVSDNSLFIAGRRIEPTEGHGLQAGAMGSLGAFAQGLAAAAPSVALASVPVSLFIVAGSGAVVAGILGLVIVLLIALTISFQSSRTVSTGSLGTYAGNGLGPGAAFIAGWSLLLGYIGFAVTGTLGAVLYLNAFLDAIGLSSQSTVFRIGLVLLIAFLAVYPAYRGAVFTAKYQLILEVAALVIILTVIVAAYVDGGATVDTEQFSLSYLAQGATFVAAVKAVGSYAGFESIASLGGEVKNAHRTISRSLIRVVILLGALYLFSTYPQVLHFGALDTDTAVLPQVAESAGIAWINVLLSAAVTVAMVVFVTAVTNSAARSLFTLSREGALPAFFSVAHPTFKTPVNGVIFIGVLSAVVASVASVSSSGRLVFDIYLGYVANWGFLIAYLLTLVATPIWLYRIKALNWWRLLVSVSALAALSYVIARNFFPTPEWPFNILPLIYLALLAVGIARYVYLRIQRPEIAARVGSIQTLSESEQERLAEIGLLKAGGDRS